MELPIPIKKFQITPGITQEHVKLLKTHSIDEILDMDITPDKFNIGEYDDVYAVAINKKPVAMKSLYEDNNSLNIKLITKIISYINNINICILKVKYLDYSNECNDEYNCIICLPKNYENALKLIICRTYSDQCFKDYAIGKLLGYSIENINAFLLWNNIIKCDLTKDKIVEFDKKIESINTSNDELKRLRIEIIKLDKLPQL